MLKLVAILGKEYIDNINALFCLGMWREAGRPDVSWKNTRNLAKTIFENNVGIKSSVVVASKICANYVVNIGLSKQAIEI
jgi:hypothetical protein